MDGCAFVPQDGSFGKAARIASFQFHSLNYLSSAPGADTEARAMIHDFTLFSPSYGNAYVNVRLLVEVGLDTGVVLPWHHIRMFWMHDPRKFHASLAFEFAYFIMVFILILDEIMQFCQSYSLSETILREKKIEARMQLRLQMLQKAAFQGLFPYRPRVLMMQVAKRLAQVDPERKQHIANLNAIGREIPVLCVNLNLFSKAHTTNALSASRRVFLPSYT
eukprot:SAG31_NODE_3107_length_4667_cov_4.409807_4_plen_220_part_00